MTAPVPEQVLAEMVDYYRARAPEYNEWWLRQGRFNRGAEANARWFADIEVVQAALQDFALKGDILELAPGTGNWTAELLRTAQTITAVDASPEMVAINRACFQSERITYVIADLFTWQPTRQYDAIFFSFWLSHVPHERLAAFWRMVATALRPGGKLFFVDSLPEATGTAHDQPLPAASTQIMTRLLNDGRHYEIVKNFFDATTLINHCQAAGLTVTVQPTAAYFYYGMGTRN
ncbi:MAG: methyltransferase domain-containing protein [Caldilineaceae bacterium]